MGGGAKNGHAKLIGEAHRESEPRLEKKASFLLKRNELVAREMKKARDRRTTNVLEGGRGGQSFGCRLKRGPRGNGGTLKTH